MYTHKSQGDSRRGVRIPQDGVRELVVSHLTWGLARAVNALNHSVVSLANQNGQLPPTPNSNWPALATQTEPSNSLPGIPVLNIPATGGSDLRFYLFLQPSPVVMEKHSGSRPVPYPPPPSFPRQVSASGFGNARGLHPSDFPILTQSQKDKG